MARNNSLIKIKLLSFLVLFSILMVGCSPSDNSIAGKGIETGGAEKQEIKEVIDPCDDLEFIQKRITSLAENIAEAETELDGLKVDLEFAREDNTNVKEIEGLLRNQEEYIANLNRMMVELQELIKEC